MPPDRGPGAAAGSTSDGNEKVKSLVEQTNPAKEVAVFIAAIAAVGVFFLSFLIVIQAFLGSGGGRS